MKKALTFIVLPLLLFAVACSDESNNNEKTNKADMIEVLIDTPTEINANELVTIAATVSQGKDKITDADEVMFEIRKSGEDDAEMIEGTHNGDGIYSIEKKFEEEGHFIVVAHVTARNMHNMPRETIIVGDASQSVSGETTSQHDHSKAYTTFDFQNANNIYQVNDEITLATTVKYGNKQLTGANVIFEVWQNDDSDHEFIQAEELDTGNYAANKTFDKAGAYNVTIHVEKDHIHEHQQSEFVVK
ncbi:FixH family protein [Salirhabdus sp. Marseille-P4669]|uniref:FixH family protein n=1 Tax=Salirhabdus sp. Marseille-P4669 TaxID=2042310 RepID=UPI000C7D16B4|nr:FixH family protein [Salirhabdus sp. Marseille-P4669]